MRYILINPADLKRKMFGFPQPQSLGYLATSIIMEGYDVEILDAAKDKLPPEKVANIVKSRSADIVGFYLLSPLVESVRFYADEVKRIYPDALIIVGGPHPTFEPEHTLRTLKSVDLACVGDGEEAIVQIKKKKPSEIPNLVWRNGDEVITNSRRFVDINKYPMPAWDLLKPDTYPTLPIGIFSEKKRIAQIIATRGCPFPCSFCGVPTISGKIIRTRKPEYIVSEMEVLVSKFGIEEIHIIDDNITAAPRRWLIDVLKTIIDARLPVKLALPSGIRIDLLDEQLLELMQKAGFYAFAVGIESANQKTLDTMKKKLTIQEITEKLKMIRKYGFHVQGNFILGYPTEGLKDTLRTIFFSTSLPIKKAGYFIFNPFPGSDEWEKLKRSYPMEMWSEIISTFNLYDVSPFVRRNIPRRLLKFLHMLAYLIFYLRPSVLYANLKKIRTFSQLKTIARILISIAK